MKLVITQEAERAYFSINFESGKGNIDERGAEELKNHFKSLNISSVKEVIFDFANVNYIGSAGIGKLLLFYKDMALNGGKITIKNVSPSIYELFNVLKLDTIFTIIKN